MSEVPETWRPRWAKPGITGSFGVSGHLLLTGAFEIGEADYWYYTPFFWRAEENGEVIFREGHGGHDTGRGYLASVLRMLSKPVFFAAKLGLRLTSYEGTGVTHAPTGRPATQVAVRGSLAGLAAAGTMAIDDETAIVLAVLVPGVPGPDPLIRIETTRFAVHDTMNAALFGAESLETPGYYSGYYYGPPEGPDPA
ncbi:MAG: hypothetical protein ACRDP5_04655 [Streptosporangiaceae bacterium]